MTKTHSNCFNYHLQKFIVAGKKSAVNIFLTLFFLALVLNSYDVVFPFGYSLGTPYTLKSIGIINYNNNTNSFSPGDYVAYFDVRDNFVLHKIVDSYPNYLIVKAGLYSNYFIYEKIYPDQIVGKVLFIYPLATTNDFYEICIKEINDENFTMSDKIMICANNVALAKAYKNNQIIIDKRNNLTYIDGQLFTDPPITIS